MCCHSPFHWPLSGHALPGKADLCAVQIERPTPQKDLAPGLSSVCSELPLTTSPPTQYVEQSELEKFDGVGTGKYTIGLGQTKMSFCDDREGQFEPLSLPQGWRP